MRAEVSESTSTPDGILRRPEVEPEFLKDTTWDGRFRYSYVPPPAAELRLPAEVRLHSEFDLDIDPVTYQVLRNRFWSINLDHSDTIRRVSGSPVIVYMDDFNTALLTETADLLMAGPSIQWFAALGDLPIKWTMENRSQNPGIAEGDVFFHNDPWIGCTHAMDVGMFAPVFHEGRIFCGYSANAMSAMSAGRSPAASTRWRTICTRSRHSSHRSSLSGAASSSATCSRCTRARAGLRTTSPSRCAARQPASTGAGAHGRGPRRIWRRDRQGRDAPHDP